VRRNFLRTMRRLASLVISALALIGAIRLIMPATAPPNRAPPGVERQLAFVRAALDDGAAERAQQLYPEGYFFLHALYGLAWVELGHRGADRSTALAEARWALAKLDSPAGRAPFDPDLVPSYGVFHAGWSTWLRGGVLTLQPADRRDPDEVRRFADDTAELAAAFDASASPYLAAYPDAAWPVDSTIAIASLRLHDVLLPPKYGGTIARWLDRVRDRLDPRTGLMPHEVHLDTGAPADTARGTSQSVIHRFLPEIDPVFAREQYLRFRDLFVVSPLGLGPAAREYPPGVNRPGDVDSGPLILGTSLSATVVTLGAAQTHRDAALANALASFAELAGAPIETPHTKRYAFGAVPIGDAFLAWSKTARSWTSAAAASPPPPPSLSWRWRLPLLCLLFLIGLSPWTPALIRLARTRKNANGAAAIP
jgi:hypothetical protein